MRDNWWPVIESSIDRMNFTCAAKVQEWSLTFTNMTSHSKLSFLYG